MKLRKSKLYNYFVNRFVPISDKTKEEVIPYDYNNALPQRMIMRVDDSGTASKCVAKRAQYVTANGFKDPQTQEKFGKYLEDASQCVSLFEAIAFIIKRDYTGEIRTVEIAPFENIRKDKSGHFVYNKYFGTKDYKKDENKFYCHYLGKKITQEQLLELATNFKDTGEILYHYKKRPGKYIYPIPVWYAGIEDIMSDAELSKYEYETITNSFISSGILTIVGEIDDKTEDDSGRTEWDYLDETLESFTGNVKDQNGKSGRNKLAVLFAKTKEEVSVFQPLTNEAILNASEAATKRIAMKVARLFDVPPFLIGIDGTVGFSTNIIADNITLFNNSIKGLQNLITEAFSMVFEGDFSLTQFKPINFIPDNILVTLTEDEKRKLIDYEPKKAEPTIPPTA